MRTLGSSSLLLALVAFAVVGLGVGAWRVSSDAARSDAARDLERAREDRDAVQDDVDRSASYLTGLKSSLGRSAMPVRSDGVEAPKGVSESLFTGDLVIGDFKDVFVDEGIVIRGIDAKEVEEIALRPVDTLPPKPRPPFRAESDDLRLVQVDLFLTNRTGDGADPACGLAGSFNGRAVLESGESGAMLQESYATTATYPTSCGAGIADGASGKVRLGIGMRKDDRLAALTFAFLGEGDSDGVTQVMVFDEPV